jgi:hypothetical protein
MSSSVLAFDIGIKNLSWCLMRANGASVDNIEILSWENYNLLQDVEGAKATVTLCSTCQKAKAWSWYSDTATQQKRFSCKRHVPVERPVLKDEGGKAITKIPAVAALRKALQSKGEDPKGLSKDTLLEKISSHWSIPLSKKELQTTKTKEVGMNELYDAIRTAVRSHWPAFQQATRVQLENQPAYKNPVMKTVQCFLFAALRESFYASLPAGHAPPAFELVHAKKKVAYEEKGDEGYKERKNASKDKVEEVLKDPVWLAKYRGSKKRDDLADTFNMCLNALSIIK